VAAENSFFDFEKRKEKNAGHAHGLRQRIEVTDGKLQAAFVVSCAIKGTRIGGEAVEALTGYALPILDVCITQRVSYPGTASAKPMKLKRR